MRPPNIRDMKMLPLKMGHGLLLWMVQAIVLSCNMLGTDFCVRKYTVLMSPVLQVETSTIHQLLTKF